MQTSVSHEGSSRKSVTHRAHLMETRSLDERLADNADKPGTHLLQTADIVSHEWISRQWRHAKCSSVADTV